MPLPDVFSFIRPNHPTVIHKAFIDRKRDRVNVEWAAGWDGDPDEPHYGYSVGMYDVNLVQRFINSGIWKVIKGV